MGGFEWLLDIVVVALLAVTLFHAVRLERALGDSAGLIAILQLEQWQVDDATIIFQEAADD